MATTTTNYGLTKPSYGDNADIAVINSNMDKIDAKMKEIEDAGGGGVSTWEEVANKPFETVGSGLSVDESGALNVTGGGSGGSSVEWNQIQTRGSKIAEVTIDGSMTEVFAPTGGSGGGSGGEVLYHQERIPTNSNTYTINFDKKPSSWIRISSFGQNENNHNYAWFLVGDPACNFLWSNGGLYSNRKATLTWAEDMMSVTVVGHDASGCSNAGTTVPMMLDYYVREGE